MNDNKEKMYKPVVRYEIEEAYEFRKWANEIPFMHFKEEWEVKVIPPFGGAIARFVVRYNNKQISCYLDCYDELGVWGSPYWEIYPYHVGENMIDTFRCGINETDLLIQKIDEEFKRSDNLG